MNTTTTMNNSPARYIAAKVELYEGSTLVNTYTYKDELINIEIVRVGEENKFFGFGVCQKANIQLRDIDRSINITTANSFKVYFQQINIDNYVSNFPTFFVTEVNRDENTNQLSITAYDALYEAANHTVSEVGLTSYNVRDFAEKISQLLGLGSSISVINISKADGSFSRNYANGANFEGTENLRTALDAIAENTQTIYYVTADNSLMFRRLDISGDPVLTIGKDIYMTLQSKDSRRLTAIVHATELGDNVASVTSGEAGSTQYVRDNPFWDLRSDIDSILSNAIAAIGGLTINQFTCSWRGNYLLDIGDKIAIVTKDDNTIISYVLNDTISYTGGLSETTSWNYTESKGETASNPATLGDALNLTFARVDKVNKEIELMASEIDENTSNISTLQINTDGILASVEELSSATETALEEANESIADLYNKASLTMTSEEVNIAIEAIQKDMTNGVDKVTTSTGFTFNDEGLTIEKTNREMKTQITENGMTVYKNDEAILTANNVGVDAANLHATTYLIIGKNSRFEDMGSNRTGCFWIGG